MTTREYYAHCRTLANGRIGANDCLRMAREAAHADREAAMRHYTPGPWHVKTLYAANGNRSAVFFEDRRKAGVYTRRLDDNGSFSHADAHLIAAAPALLAALRAMTAPYVGDVAERYSALGLARAALKLARGEG